MRKICGWFAACALVAIMAACGATTSSTTNSGATNPAYPTATDVATKAATGVGSIGTGSATVKGSAKMVLTGPTGLTLYYRTDETATQVKCTGGCLSAWPPVLAPAGVPSTTSKLSGVLTILGDSQRPQVEYNGHPLYSFASDTSAGEANGDGVGGIWYVVTPDLAASANGYSAVGNH